MNSSLKQKSVENILEYINADVTKIKLNKKQFTIKWPQHRNLYFRIVFTVIVTNLLFFIL